MRFSLSILSASLLAISVYAADLAEPKLAEHAVSCLLNVNGVTSQVQIVKNSIDQLTKDESRISTIYKKEQLLEEFIRQSHSCCVTIRPKITDNEVVAASDSLSLLTADVVATLKSIQEKKSLFDKDTLTYAHISSLIGNLDNETDYLFRCLLFKTPDKYLPLISEFKETIQEAFDAAKIAFDV